MNVNNAGTLAIPQQREHNLSNMPINALGHKAKSAISLYLNAEKVLESEEGYQRDWRGFAQLAGIPVEHISMLTTHSDPTAKILFIWGKNATIQQFMDIMDKIDRWDLVDDLEHLIDEDAKTYFERTLQPLPQIEEPSMQQVDILTSDDVKRNQLGLDVQTYDAFVLYAEEDIDFAADLINRLEDYGFKLCDRSRDILGGMAFEHESIGRLIAERCNQLIVILSPAFLESSVNTFFFNFAQALGIANRKNKIIPCFYQRCTVPTLCRFLFSLDYQRSDRLYNFWDKLRETLERSRINSTVCSRAVSSVVIREVETPSYSARLPAIRSSSQQSATSSNTLTINNNHLRSRSESSELSQSLQEMNLTNSISDFSLEVDLTGSTSTLNNNEKIKSKRTNLLKKIFHPKSLIKKKDENKEKKNKLFKRKTSVPS